MNSCRKVDKTTWFGPSSGLPQTQIKFQSSGPDRSVLELREGSVVVSNLIQYCRRVQ